ncbi:hypothetical protein FWD20_01325, partial [Candidatus Saccharibacteria bacterium]|nr:hypothetical protein [Candidatus Saccharibacteria bacterium]
MPRRFPYNLRWGFFINIVTVTALGAVLLSTSSPSAVPPVVRSTPAPAIFAPTEPMAFTAPTESDCPELDEDSRTPHLISIPSAHIENACM